MSWVAIGVGVAALTSAYTIDSSEQAKRNASQKGNAMKLDTAAAMKKADLEKERDTLQAAQLAARNRKKDGNPLAASSDPAAVTALGTAPQAPGATLLGR